MRQMTFGRLSYLPKFQVHLNRIVQRYNLLKFETNTKVLITNRCYCQNGRDNANLNVDMPPLMKGPELNWPSSFMMLRNWCLISFVVRPYLDRDFIFTDFLNGSKQAVVLVSNIIYDGRIKNLVGLVTDDVIEEVQTSLSKMSLEQRNNFLFTMDDIYLSFPYQIDVIKDKDSNERRFLEIKMVYHMVKDLPAIKNTLNNSGILERNHFENLQKNFVIGNFQFIKDFAEGVNSDWTINFLNYFQPNKI